MQGWQNGGTDTTAYFNTGKVNVNLVDPSTGLLQTPGLSAHKPRVQDNGKIGVVVSLPDEPHDFGANPMTDTTSGLPQLPMLSVAVRSARRSVRIRRPCACSRVSTTRIISTPVRPTTRRSVRWKF